MPTYRIFSITPLNNTLVYLHNWEDDEVGENQIVTIEAKTIVAETVVAPLPLVAT